MMIELEWFVYNNIFIAIENIWIIDSEKNTLHPNMLICFAMPELIVSLIRLPTATEWMKMTINSHKNRIYIIHTRVFFDDSGNGWRRWCHRCIRRWRHYGGHWSQINRLMDFSSIKIHRNYTLIPLCSGKCPNVLDNGYWQHYMSSAFLIQNPPIDRVYFLVECFHWWVK